MGNPTAQLPVMGLGVGIWGAQIAALLEQLPDPDSIDYIELYADNLADIAKVIDTVPDHLSVVLHGVGLSLIGADPIPDPLMEETKRVAQKANTPWVLEDLSVWRLDGKKPLSGPFWPPVFDQQALDLVVTRTEMLSQVFEKPFLCEVPPLDIILGDMRVGEFFYGIAERTACSFVLDVSHWLRVMQLENISETEAWEQFPMQNVAELHISGGRRVPGQRWYEEEHSSPLLPESIDLLDSALHTAENSRAVTIESHGSEAQTLIESIGKINRLETIQQLRARRSERMERKPVEHVQFVSPQQPSSPAELLDKQRSVRDFLEIPATLYAALINGAQAGEKARSLKLRQKDAWLRAATRYWKRKIQLPQITHFVLAKSGNDMGKMYGDFLASNDLSLRDTFETYETADFFADYTDIPEWAQTCCRFEADVLRVSQGKKPASYREGLQGEETYLCDYPMSITATINALKSCTEIPDPEPVTVRMTIENNELTVSEV